MRDVARLAGVSVATVSAVVNGSATVSPHSAKKVRDAMEALDYHPDQVARSLRVGRTDVIGMVIPDITNAFFTELVRGVEDAGHVRGYSVILCNSNEDPEQERRHLSTLFSRRVDGVIIACSDSSAAYDRLLSRRFPIVFVDRVPQGVNRSGISTDNVEASYRATRHLLELGHERLAWVGGKLWLSPFADRLEGFRKAMQERGLAVRQEYLITGMTMIESGHQAARELFSLSVPPSAVFIGNNKMLLGFMRALAELHVRCPEDVSILGYDDYAWTEHFTPRLTVVAQQTYEMGRRGMEILLSKIRDAGEDRHESEPELVLLPAELRIRESTACCSRQIKEGTQ
jgi:LacI family transcriptional regulator